MMGVWVCNQVDTWFHGKVEKVFLVIHMGIVRVYSGNVNTGVFGTSGGFFGTLGGFFWYIFSVFFGICRGFFDTSRGAFLVSTTILHKKPRL